MISDFCFKINIREKGKGGGHSTCPYHIPVLGRVLTGCRRDEYTMGLQMNYAHPVPNTIFPRCQGRSIWNHELSYQH